MLLYERDIDSLFWHEPGVDQPPFDGVWIDVSEEIWAVERAVDENLGMPEAERHLAFLRDCAEIVREVDMQWALAHPDDEYWQGL